MLVLTFHVNNCDLLFSLNSSGCVFFCIHVGLLLVMFLLYVMGRKYAMALQLMFCTVFFSLLYVCAGK